MHSALGAGIAAIKHEDIVAGAVIAMQIATVVDVAQNCVEFKTALDKGDVNGAIAAGVAVGMATVPGQKLIPAPIRKAVQGVVTKSIIRILNSKYGQAAVKAGGELVDKASSQVQSLTNKAANSKAGQAFSNSKIGKGLQNAGDRLVQHVEGTATHQAEKGVAKDIDLRLKGKYSGGAYGKLDRVPGRERHHMPADSITEVSRAKGPSIQMDAFDHALTSSYGNSLKAQEYRKTMKTMLDSDKMRDVMAMEIKDVKSNTGTKYNSALIEMLEYAKESGQLLPKPSLK